MAHFRKLDSGWEYRIKYRDPYTGKYKEKSKRGFPTKTEAKVAATEMERKLLSGIDQAPSLLREYLYTWLNEYRKGNVRKNTYELDERNVQNHIIPYFQNIKLNDIKPVMYQKFLNHLNEQGYKKRTIELIHGTMSNAMKTAVRPLKKIESNPCEGVVIKGKDNKRDAEFIDSQDVPVFLKQAYKYGYIYWIFFKFMIYTGLRKGEAAALQWSDIDLKDKTVSVTKTLDFQAKIDEPLFGDTKTYKSTRTVTISQEIVNDLNFHIKYQNQNKLAINEIYRHDLNLVFCRNDGDILPKSSLFNAFERILKRTDIPKLPIHSLRHTHAVLQLEAGADMKYIQERLGHGSMRITSDVYAHVSKKLEHKNMSKFEEYMNSLL